jgi:membrane associated rhomboid family serine protease
VASPRYSGVSFGPGPITPAVKAIIIANVAVFLVTFALPEAVIGFAGLSPAAVIERGWIWQLATYLFVHSPSSLMHIVFNMLAVWMFGVDLERRWGTVGFTKFYFVSGVGAGICTVLVSLAPYDWALSTYQSVTVGASGAVYGLLMAWALLFPYREILFMFIFPLQARMFVLIIGAIAFLSAVGSSGTGVSNLAHLGGLLAGWLYLKGPRELRLELRYRLTKWRMDRMRKKFNVHRGGRDDDWTRRIH